MKNVFRFVQSIGFIWLVICINGPLHAQPVQQDSLFIRPPTTPAKEIGRLKGALRQTISSIETADSLLAATRKLNFLPGQVIALCQLAALQLKRQQPQQANQLLQEAGQLAGQITDFRDAGWTMSQVGRIQRLNSMNAVSFVPVVQSLSKAMNVSGAVPGRGNENDPFSGTIPNRADKRYAGRGNDQSNPAELNVSVPVPGFDPRALRYARLKPDFVDRWIDSLIHVDKSSPQVVSQLTTRKKLRDTSKELSKAFAKEGDYAKAYQYYLQYTAYKDSLTAEATSRRLALLAYRQNLQKKESQIQLLTKDRQLREQASSRQRQFMLILTGCVALLIAFLLILTRNNRAKQLANRQLHEQKEALQQTLAELKTAQEQLIQAEKMASLGELTAGIAHEIQNPLNFVNNFSDVSSELITELIENRHSLERDEELEDELLADVRLNLEKIHQHGNRASSIVKGMLEHARTTSGQKEPTDVNALTDEYLKLAYHGIRAKDKTFDAKLVTQFDSSVGTVTLIPQDLGRVLLNLFTNAFYAVHKRQQEEGAAYQPEVRVQTKREGRQLVLRVRDNGIGVPASIRQKIFQPFFTTKPTGQGTGLGLSLSYDIITKGHGGTFTLDSVEGEFTELTITIPAN